MRHYPSGSPRAVARVLALTLLADGAIDFSEMQVLDRHDLDRQFGLDPWLFDEVVKDFCFDLALYGDRSYGAQPELDKDTVAALLRDVRDPRQQIALLRVMVDVVNADGAIAGGEAALIAEAMRIWELDPHRLDRERAPSNVQPRRHGRRANDRDSGARTS